MWLAATGYVSDSRLFLLDYALRALRVGVLLSIWRTIAAANSDALPMSLASLLTYTLIAEVFAHPLGVQTRLSDSLWQGTLVHYFLRPVGVVRQFAAEMTGQWGVDFVFFSIPLLLLAPLLGVAVLPVDAAAAMLFAISLALAVLVGLAMEFIFGALSLILDQPVWLVEWVRRALGAILSGAMIPLAVLPWGLGDVFEWLPFASMAWAPLAIFTGVGDAAHLLILQLVWAAVLWVLALSLWSRNREKVVGHGG